MWWHRLGRLNEPLAALRLERKAEGMLPNHAWRLEHRLTLYRRNRLNLLCQNGVVNLSLFVSSNLQATHQQLLHERCELPNALIRSLELRHAESSLRHFR